MSAADVAGVAQFDHSIGAIAKYTMAHDRADVRDTTADALVLHTVDSIGCALGAFDEGPCQAVRRIAATGRAAPGAGASVIGLAERSTVELATFANSSLVRYLDFNDNYLRNGGGHTSDLLPAILAAGETARASGMQVLVALDVAYEVFAALADAVFLRDRGWDYPAFLEIAAAAGVAKVLGLDEFQTGNAVAMAITPNLPLGITRAGELANWKGLASPYAAMAGVFATRLAAEGLTGPPRAFEGVRGLWALATGPFSLDALGQPVDGRTAAERSSYKLYVAEFNAQGPVHEAVRLRERGIGPDDIESIHIRTYEVAWSEIGGGQDDHADKWDPQNKETADHSLPYMVAVALTDGEVTARSYDLDRVRDPALRPLLDRITVEPDEALSADWNQRPSHVIEVALRSGERLTIRADFPPGHPENPMTRDQILAKYRSQAVPVVGEPATEALLATLLDLERLGDVNQLTDHFRSVGR
jgi:2-methylcitrate dehydratase